MYHVEICELKHDSSVKYVKSKFVQIKNLLFDSFGSNIGVKDLDNFLLDVETVFIVHDNNRIIGSAFVQSEKRISKFKSKKPTYMCVNHDSKYLLSVVTLYPLINALCRNLDPKYKGVGSLILDSIFSHYEKNNIENIYLISRSARKETPTDVIDDVIKNNTNTETINIISKKNKNIDSIALKYYTSNKQLINFYKNFGFDIYDNYYYCEINKEINSCIYQNILKKKLLKKSSKKYESKCKQCIII